jgi:adenylate cyclase
LCQLQSEVIQPAITIHDGRVIRLAGDGMLVIFPSATGALLCALEMQRELAERGRSVPPCERLLFRIGLNVADILIDDREIAGGGVNLAARLEAIAEPGGICVSRAFKDQVHEQSGIRFIHGGARRVKNIARPVRVFHVVWGARPAMDRIRLGLRRFATSPLLALITGGAVGAALLALVVAQLHLESSDRDVIRILVPATDTDGGSDDVHIEISIAAERKGNLTLVSGADRSRDGHHHHAPLSNARLAPRAHVVIQ